MRGYMRHQLGKKLLSNQGLFAYLKSKHVTFFISGQPVYICDKRSCDGDAYPTDFTQGKLRERRDRTA